MKIEWHNAYTVEMGVERFIRVTQAMYDMRPIPGIWVSEEGKLYLASRAAFGGFSNALKPAAIFTDSYPHIRRREGVIYKNYRVHRIIACTLNPIENLDYIRGTPPAILETAKRDAASMLYLYHTSQVNHINHDSKDYRLENLEWCTAFENTKAYHKHAGFEELRASKEAVNEELEEYIHVSRLDKRLRSYMGKDNVVTIRKIG